MCLMMLILTVSMSRLYAQSICDDLELHVGASIPLDCYRVKVPVYFNYIGAGTPPASFSACAIIVDGEITNGKVVQCA